MNSTRLWTVSSALRFSFFFITRRVHLFFMPVGPSLFGRWDRDPLYHRKNWTHVVQTIATYPGSRPTPSTIDLDLTWRIKKNRTQKIAGNGLHAVGNCAETLRNSRQTRPIFLFYFAVLTVHLPKSPLRGTSTDRNSFSTLGYNGWET